MIEPGDANGADDIAIIGMAGRFPGAQNVDAFWRNIRDGVNAISFFAEEEIEEIGFDDGAAKAMRYVQARGLLEGIELFDAPFFGYTRREAEIMDPQQRLFLECAWEALEHAGYDSNTYRGRIGVHAGASLNGYLLRVLTNREAFGAAGAFQATVSNDRDQLCARASYKLNLNGPSIAVQTACSTSLVAVALACQSLQNYQCDMSLAGGVAIKVPQKGRQPLETGGINAPDGYCRAFDARARGTVGGSGVGIVILKRLADAEADGDYVHAVIKGAAVNNDGAAKISYTAPSVSGQAEVIADAIAMARVNPETITYVEAHGTGTPLGDPIEVTALTKAFREWTRKKGFCGLGSVKTNVGHLDSAAGITGLIKTVLALKHKLLPPSLNFEQPNPEIDFENTPFYVNTTLAEWGSGDTPRRAGVSSFGIGGTNAHVVLEEAPSRAASDGGRAAHLLLLSASTDSALELATSNLIDYLQRHPEANLADVAFTLQVGRRGFDHRRMLVARDVADALRKLGADERAGVYSDFRMHRDPSLVMMFPGQGSHYANIARHIYEEEPTFRSHFERCCDLLEPSLRESIRGAVCSHAEADEGTTLLLRQTRIAQPALFIIEYALAQLWMSWGVRPAAMIGHSLGEYVAACLSGVMSLEEALPLVVARGQLMQQLPGGSMLAVQLSESDARLLLRDYDGLSLGAVNGLEACVISGHHQAIGQFQERCVELSIQSKRLETSHAFHSQMVAPMAGEFTALLGDVCLKPPQLPYISNVTGTWITTAEATEADYWARHLLQPVRFADGMRELQKEPKRVALEVGPGQTLTALFKRAAPDSTGLAAYSSLPYQSDRQPGPAPLLETLGRLWLVGVEVDWQSFHAGYERRRIPLPTYPFERQPYWVAQGDDLHNVETQRDSPTASPEPATLLYTPVWKQSPAMKQLRSNAPIGETPHWLLFVDDCGLGEAIAEELKGRGQEVMFVRPGAKFDSTGDGAYSIRPGAGGDYLRLFDELRRLGQLPTNIAHLWSVNSNESGLSPWERAESCRVLGFDSLLLLAQALGEDDNDAGFQVEVISNNVHDVTGDELLCPEKAAILGPCLVVPREFPNIRCRSIDVALPAAGRVTDALAGQLVTEFFTRAEETLVAYRRNHRWVRTAEAVRLDEEVPPPLLLKEDGVYFFTGDLQPDVLAIAESFAKSARVNLVLTSASEFPPRSEWEHQLASDAASEVRGRIERLREIEELGAQVVVTEADVADPEQMQGVADLIRRRFGRLDGVIHAGGAPAPEIIKLKAVGTPSDVLNHRMKETFVLDSLTETFQPDFFVLFSSYPPLTGAVGLVDFCAANAFLDAFAHYHHSLGRRATVAINWGIRQWEKWQDVFTAGVPGVHARLERLRETHGISSAESADALRFVLSQELPQVIVSKGTLQRAQGEQELLTGEINAALEAIARVKPDSSRAATGETYLAPRDPVEEAVAEIWRDIFGLPRVGVRDNFFELGGNSLLGIQLMSRLRKTFLRDLPMTVLFESPTVAEMSAVVAENQLKEKEFEDLGRMIAEIESLSPEELEDRLAGFKAEEEEVSE